VGTTKLTRKEILAEDPVHEGIVQLIEFVRENGKKIGIVAVALVLVAIAAFFGLQYLEDREMQAQERLGKGIGFFHAQIAPDAKDDPYGKGPSPTFRSDSAKYQAAAREFAAVADGYSFGKIAIVARYYLGISQLRIGKKKEAVQNLESVAGNSKNRALGFLAKRALAVEYGSSGNHKAAADLLTSMIKDPQCQLPGEELSIQLAKVLDAQGKRSEAIKVLREANAQGPAFSSYKQQLTMELDKLQKTPADGPEAQASRP
jgi:predicted negative regulator of RcsB-dependent stress response